MRDLSSSSNSSSPTLIWLSGNESSSSSSKTGKAAKTSSTSPEEAIIMTAMPVVWCTDPNSVNNKPTAFALHGIQLQGNVTQKQVHALRELVNAAAEGRLILPSDGTFTLLDSGLSIESSIVEQESGSSMPIRCQCKAEGSSRQGGAAGGAGPSGQAIAAAAAQLEFLLEPKYSPTPPEAHSDEEANAEEGEGGGTEEILYEFLCCAKCMNEQRTGPTCAGRRLQRYLRTCSSGSGGTSVGASGRSSDYEPVNDPATWQLQLDPVSSIASKYARRQQRHRQHGTVSMGIARNRSHRHHKLPMHSVKIFHNRSTYTPATATTVATATGAMPIAVGGGRVVSSVPMTLPIPSPIPIPIPSSNPNPNPNSKPSPANRASVGSEAWRTLGHGGQQAAPTAVDLLSAPNEEDILLALLETPPATPPKPCSPGSNSSSRKTSFDSTSTLSSMDSGFMEMQNKLEALAAAAAAAVAVAVATSSGSGEATAATSSLPSGEKIERRNYKECLTQSRNRRKSYEEFKAMFVEEATGPMAMPPTVATAADDATATSATASSNTVIPLSSISEQETTGSKPDCVNEFAAAAAAASADEMDTGDGDSDGEKGAAAEGDLTATTTAAVTTPLVSSTTTEAMRKNSDFLSQILDHQFAAKERAKAHKRRTSRNFKIYDKLVYGTIYDIIQRKNDIYQKYDKYMTYGTIYEILHRKSSQGGERWQRKSLSSILEGTRSSGDVIYDIVQRRERERQRQQRILEATTSATVSAISPHKYGTIYDILQGEKLDASHVSSKPQDPKPPQVKPTRFVVSQVEEPVQTAPADQPDARVTDPGVAKSSKPHKMRRLSHILNYSRNSGDDQLDAAGKEEAKQKRTQAKRRIGVTNLLLPLDSEELYTRIIAQQRRLEKERDQDPEAESGSDAELCPRVTALTKSSSLDAISLSVAISPASSPSPPRPRRSLKQHRCLQQRQPMPLVKKHSLDNCLQMVSAAAAIPSRQPLRRWSNQTPLKCTCHHHAAAEELPLTANEKSRSLPTACSAPCPHTCPSSSSNDHSGPATTKSFGKLTSTSTTTTAKKGKSRRLSEFTRGEFLNEKSWYFRKIKRIEAEKKLLLPENEHGAFLIRDSESRHNDYSLSVRDGDTVKHYRIRQLDEGGFFIARRTTFRTLQELVEHYSKDSDGLCVNLCKPCVQVRLHGKWGATVAIVCFGLIAHFTSDLPPNVWMRGTMITFAFDIVMPWFSVHFEMPNTRVY
ncbi:hypothetical protein M5D96_009566 [Drosophila gunungcola]|uniref:non-specific protein-tyrosine kinase n=1 Tax=Drosophila gunungcola TaxID=103775 RepID=A0A9Q0BN08_9MUSC|nr:hypothetical protein M5D96_009566 [Drosophila gunungcola]